MVLQDVALSLAARLVNLKINLKSGRKRSAMLVLTLSQYWQKKSLVVFRMGRFSSGTAVGGTSGCRFARWFTNIPDKHGQYYNKEIKSQLFCGNQMSIYFLLTTTLEAQHTSRALIDEPMELSRRYLQEKNILTQTWAVHVQLTFGVNLSEAWSGTATFSLRAPPELVCILFTCSLILSFRLNCFPQSSHMNSFASVCFTICIFNLSLPVKLFSQDVQAYLFSAWKLLMCFLILGYSVNVF